MKNRIITSLLAGVSFLFQLNAQEVSFNAVYKVIGEPGSSEDTYRSHFSTESVNIDESAVLIENGARHIITSARINKTGGQYSYSELRNMYGVNSAVLVKDGSSLLLENPILNVHTSCADGVTSSGPGTSVRIQDGQFSLSRDNNTALRVIDGGSLTSDNSVVNTLDNHSPAVASCQPGSKAVINGMKGGTNGIGSPLFLTSGELSAGKCLLQAGASQISTVENGGSLTIEKCELRGSGHYGFLLYSPDSGNNHPEGKLIITSSKLTVKGGPLFYATNTNAGIYMEKTKVLNNSGILLCASKDDWGSDGENGARVTVRAARQKLNGDILIDSISSVNIRLEKGASLTGTVNPDGNLSAESRIFIAKGANWSSKESSYVTSIEFEEPVATGVKHIKSKSDIYYRADDPSSYQLGGKEYNLSGGGRLRPL